MPRKKLSEYRSKILVNGALGLGYVGWSVTSLDDLDDIDGYDEYVVKVDQAVKGRFKKGLVLLGIKRGGLGSAAKQLFDKGYSSLIVEPQINHDQKSERYIALSHDRSGYHFAHSPHGGVDVEAHPESIKRSTVTETFDWDKLAKATSLPAESLQTMLKLFQDNHFAFLEINPYVVQGKQVTILDVAIEVDDAGQYFTGAWSGDDIRAAQAPSEAEKYVRELNDNSPASFSLTILNPDGAVFLLLSGGGASIVVADEVYNRGFGKQLANYGEYSGNPNTDETHLYTKQVLRLITHSKAPKKILFIGGAVANFTDIANTFAGVIAAIDEVADELKKQKLKVYVRRGGPNQEIGLKKIEEALKKHGILGGVYDPHTSITDALGDALKGLKG